MIILRINNYYLFDQFNRFGRYGDAVQPTEREDEVWIDVIEPVPSPAPKNVTNGWENMITGIEYEILISQKGFKNNLHTYIVAINTKLLQEDIISATAVNIPFRVAFTYFFVKP